jgi:hypothetical protein
MTFKTDLDFSRVGETELLNSIEYDSFEKAPDKKFSDWDIKLTYKGINVYYEVKTDRLTSKTGNMCIEFNCNNIPSGIETTKSDYYFYVCINEPNNELYLIPVDVIKRKIRHNRYHRIMNGGDGYRSKFYLFNKKHFKKYKF